jgi:hypothetical protein
LASADDALDLPGLLAGLLGQAQTFHSHADLVSDIGQQFEFVCAHVKLGLHNDTQGTHNLVAGAQRHAKVGTEGGALGQRREPGVVVKVLGAPGMTALRYLADDALTQGDRSGRGQKRFRKIAGGRDDELIGGWI